jgi:putative transposase
MKVTRSGYYAWKKREVSDHDIEDLILSQEIIDIYNNSRNIYGSPRILMMLRRKGIHTSKRRVERLMRENGIKGVSKRAARPKQKKASEQESAHDLVMRNFSSDEPNKLWFADITYVRTYEGWLYLAVVFDIYSRMIVGWSMSSHMTADLVDDALKMGIKRRRPSEGLVHHSDHGSQYRSILLGKTMQSKGIVPSMGSVATPGDNAVTESLMSTIKAECVHRRIFKTRHEAKLEIFDYIECFYNRERIHSSLDYLSPLEFEAKMSKELARV